MSLHDACKHQLVAQGGIPVLLPLLGCKVHEVRWSARTVRTHMPCY